MALSDLIKTITEPEYFAKLMDRHRTNGVPVSSWLSVVNTCLSLTHSAAELFAELRTVVAKLAASMFLGTAEGVGLTELARSHFSLERYPAVHARHYFLITNRNYEAAPAHDIGAGELIAGTEGADGLLFTSEADVSLEAADNVKAGYSLVPMGAQLAGVAYNLPAYSPLKLRTPFVGVDVENPPVLLVPGADANGGVVYAPKEPSVPEVQIVQRVSGAATALSVEYLVGAGIPKFRVNVATNALGAPTSTARQIVEHIRTSASAPATEMRGFLVLAWTGDGSGVVGRQPLAILTSSIVRTGQDEEADGTIAPPTGLKGRCISRWSTLGTGGNEEAMIYWARVAPVGYPASPVTKVRVLSNFLDGVVVGDGVTVMVAGDGGALLAADLAAVAANFEGPKKYPLAVRLAVVTTQNRTIALIGTVYVLRGAGYTVGEVRTAVLAELARYQAQLDIGGQGYKVYKQKIGARIEAALPGAIRNVELSGPAADVTLLYRETVVFDAMSLAFIEVDV